MRIPLIGVPRTLWNSLASVTGGGIALALWRVFLLALVPAGLYVLVLLGPGGVALGIVMFVLTTLATWFWKDEIVSSASDVWNMDWAEVTI